MRGATPLDVAAASVMDNNELALALREPDLDKVSSLYVLFSMLLILILSIMSYVSMDKCSVHMQSHKVIPNCFAVPFLVCVPPSTLPYIYTFLCVHCKALCSQHIHCD